MGRAGGHGGHQGWRWGSPFYPPGPLPALARTGEAPPVKLPRPRPRP
ncbi:hypothetical protein AZ78_0963 [Lysobacter capsici AZ78]|uniref:Uncharacterized protein n=1 Tax=Lysobacter capsici AZ78 TaxID=1444315 RepID=A0A108U6E7_9GAMM|nr:hypothetical protein AZ78_0963 [Lysobacter capsici AZ78]